MRAHGPRPTDSGQGRSVPPARWLGAVLGVVLAGAACVGPATSPQPAPSGASSRPGTRPVDASQVQRLQRVMTPLIRAMNRPRPLSEVRVGIVDNRALNAANAGSGEFYVTTGLLEQAGDEQLLG